jgi:hypothetical protein
MGIFAGKLSHYLGLPFLDDPRTLEMGVLTGFRGQEEFDVGF